MHFTPRNTNFLAKISRFPRTVVRCSNLTYISRVLDNSTQIKLRWNSSPRHKNKHRKSHRFRSSSDRLWKVLAHSNVAAYGCVPETLFLQGEYIYVQRHILHEMTPSIFSDHWGASSSMLEKERRSLLSSSSCFCPEAGTASELIPPHHRQAVF